MGCHASNPTHPALLQRELSEGAVMDREQLFELLDVASDLLTDNNYKAALATLQIWRILMKREGDTLKPHANVLLPLVVRQQCSIPARVGHMDTVFGFAHGQARAQTCPHRLNGLEDIRQVVPQEAT